MEVVRDHESKMLHDVPQDRDVHHLTTGLGRALVSRGACTQASREVRSDHETIPSVLRTSEFQRFAR